MLSGTSFKRLLLLTVCFIIAIESSASNETSSVCPVSQDVRLEKQYHVHNEKAVTYMEAWRLCQQAGHRLATITSVKDSQLVEQAIANSSNTKGPWYIGGTDEGSEGNFIWISTNKPIQYSNYSPGQPDNAGGNENCLEIGRWGGVVWNDVPCGWKQRYICEQVCSWVNLGSLSDLLDFF